MKINEYIMHLYIYIYVFKIYFRLFSKNLKFQKWQIGGVSLFAQRTKRASTGTPHEPQPLDQPRRRRPLDSPGAHHELVPL